MYVYELAIQIGRKSSELTEAAEHLGLGHLSPASAMSPEQHDRLVQHFTGQGVAPRSGPAPLAVPGLGGLPAGPPLAGGLGAPGPSGMPGAPPPTPAPSGVRPMVVVGAVVATLVLLCGGAYAFMGKSDQRLEDKAAAEQAAEDRRDAEEMAAEDAASEEPASAEAEAAAKRTHAARCAAMQQIVEVDREIEGNLQFGAMSFVQWRFAVDKLVEKRDALRQAHVSLRGSVPEGQRGQVDELYEVTDALVVLYDETRTYEQAVTLHDRATPLVDRYDRAREAVYDANDDCDLYYG